MRKESINANLRMMECEHNNHCVMQFRRRSGLIDSLGLYHHIYSAPTFVRGPIHCLYSVHPDIRMIIVWRLRTLLHYVTLAGACGMTLPVPLERNVPIKPRLRFADCTR